MPLRAILWAAVSTKPQLKKKIADGEEEDKDSLPSQLIEARAYAQKMGWDVVAELSVPGHSRDYIFWHEITRDIPAYAELQRLADQRAFDVLVVRGRDRLGRTDAIIATTEAVCAQAGAQVLSLAVPTPIKAKRDRADLYLSAIERAQAEGEIMELRRRHEGGMRGRTFKGLPTNKLPFPWIRGPDGLPELPEDRLATIRRILDLFAHRQWTYYRIARTLNDEHITAPGGGDTWDPKYIKELLRNPFNRGLIIWGRHSRPQQDWIVAPSRYPAIFSAEEIDLIDAELARRRELRRGASSTRPWSGLIICARCGKKMSYACAKGHQYYRCAVHQRMHEIGSSRPCHSNHVRLEKIEEAASAALQALANEETLDAAMRSMAEGGEGSRLRRQLEEIAAAIGRIEGERERLTTAYLRSILEIDEFERRMEILAADLERQRRQATEWRRQLRRTPDPTLRREDLRAIIPEALRILNESAEPEEARRILRIAFRAIYCENGDVTRIVMW